MSKQLYKMRAISLRLSIAMVIVVGRDTQRACTFLPISGEAWRASAKASSSNLTSFALSPIHRQVILGEAVISRLVPADEVSIAAKLSETVMGVLDDDGRRNASAPERRIVREIGVLLYA